MVSRHKGLNKIFVGGTSSTSVTKKSTVHRTTSTVSTSTGLDRRDSKVQTGDDLVGKSSTQVQTEDAKSELRNSEIQTDSHSYEKAEKTVQTDKEEIPQQKSEEKAQDKHEPADNKQKDEEPVSTQQQKPKEKEKVENGESQLVACISQTSKDGTTSKKCCIPISSGKPTSQTNENSSCATQPKTAQDALDMGNLQLSFTTSKDYPNLNNKPQQNQNTKCCPVTSKVNGSQMSNTATKNCPSQFQECSSTTKCYNQQRYPSSKISSFQQTSGTGVNSGYSSYNRFATSQQPSRTNSQLNRSEQNVKVIPLCVSNSGNSLNRNAQSYPCYSDSVSSSSGSTCSGDDQDDYQRTGLNAMHLTCSKTSQCSQCQTKNVKYNTNVKRYV